MIDAVIHERQRRPERARNRQPLPWLPRMLVQAAILLLGPALAMPVGASPTSSHRSAASLGIQEEEGLPYRSCGDEGPGGPPPAGRAPERPPALAAEGEARLHEAVGKIGDDQPALASYELAVLAEDLRLPFLRQAALLYEGIALDAGGLAVLAAARFAAAASARRLSQEGLTTQALRRLGRIEQDLPGVCALVAPELLLSAEELPDLPELASLRVAAALDAYHQRENARARRLLARVRGSGRPQARARMLEVGIAVSLGEMEAARKAINAAIASAPKGSRESDAARLALARWLYGKRELPGALARYQAVRPRSTAGPEAAVEADWLRHELGQSSTALRNLLFRHGPGGLRADPAAYSVAAAAYLAACRPSRSMAVATIMLDRTGEPAQALSAIAAGKWPPQALLELAAGRAPRSGPRISQAVARKVRDLLGLQKGRNPMLLVEELKAEAGLLADPLGSWTKVGQATRLGQELVPLLLRSIEIAAAALRFKARAVALSLDQWRAEALLARILAAETLKKRLWHTLREKKARSDEDPCIAAPAEKTGAGRGWSFDATGWIDPELTSGSMSTQREAR